MKFKNSVFIYFFIIVLILCLPFMTVYATDINDCAEGRHQDVIISEQQPTETQDGEITYQCQICGREYTDNLPAIGHTWSVWIIDKAPTCTETGGRHRTCTLHAPHDESETIPSLGHNYVKTVKEPTLTEEGLITYICSKCNNSYTEPYGTTHKHEYEESVVIPPACTEDGIKIFTCFNGDDSYTQSISAAGHSFSEWVIETEAKAGVSGKRYRQCVNCGLREEEWIPALKEQSLFNKNDIIINSINLFLLVTFSMLITPYVLTVRWYAKKQKKFLKSQELTRLEAEKYDFH